MTTDPAPCCGRDVLVFADVFQYGLINGLGFRFGLD